MINHFTFHSVGQGLFYTGCLNHGDYTFVYDCGSTSKTHLQSEINKFVQHHKDIDFVVLSHMHDDHIIGITDLCQRCNVKKLYLPYLGADNEVIALILANELLTGNSSPASLEAFYTMSYLYGVTDVAENGQRLWRTEVEFWGNGDEKDPKIDRKGFIYSSHNFTYLDNERKPYWEFKMLNRAMGVGILHQLSAKLRSLLNNHASVLNQSVSILDLVKTGSIDVIKQIYHQVFASVNINLTSTLLIHYPTDINAQSSIKCCKFCCMRHCRLCKRLRCYCTTTVLTGDVSFNDHLSNEVNKVLSTLPHCVLQIPHHGSLPNWKSIDTTLLNHSDIFVISHGHNHKYHPNGSALLQMQGYLCRNNIRSVTQFQDYKYVILT